MSGSHKHQASNTRKRLLDTFNSLVLRGKAGKITVSDIVREAGVGRSTFYDHYASAEDIHEQALAGPMTLLAESILGLQTADRLQFLLEHFRENRRRARRTLCGDQGDKVEQLLVAILESRLSSHPGSKKQTTRIAAIELAVVPLSLIRAWLDGRVQGTSAEMAAHIARASAAIRATLL